MNDRSHRGFGLVGMLMMALCCLAPVLLIGTGVVSVSVLTGATVYVLLPILVIFAVVVGFLLWRRRPHSDSRDH